MAKVLALTAGTVGAIYYGNVGWQVYQTSSEESRIQNRRDAELSAAEAAKASIVRDEQRVSVLEKEYQMHKEAAALLTTEITSLRRQLSEAESKKKASEQSAEEAAAFIQKCKKQMTDAAADIRRRLENAKVADEALGAAHIHAAEARRLLNPLNNPVVQNLIGKK